MSTFHSADDAGDVLQALIQIPVNKRTTPLAFMVWNSYLGQWEQCSGVSMEVTNAGEEHHVFFYIDPTQ